MRNPTAHGRRSRRRLHARRRQFFRAAPDGRGAAPKTLLATDQPPNKARRFRRVRRFVRAACGFPRRSDRRQRSSATTEALTPSTFSTKEPVWRGWSAQHTLTGRQRAAGLLLVIAGVFAVVVFGLTHVAAAVASGVLLVHAATSALRLSYIWSGYRAEAYHGEPEGVSPALLPRYTVLVALYKEAAVVPALLDSLDRLEYPAEKLQVVLLCEQDDAETARACQANLRPGWELLVVPPGVPRTKPRALNAGLPLVTGEFFTIYDAEDRPEADQLVKAVEDFRRRSPAVAALQARLDFYNARQTIITRWFTCDYAGHFGLFLRGLAARRHPVPLGGTSTHFRTQLVRDVGGWDSWNVTEDCELGMRLGAAGFTTGVLDSVTWEEAVPRPRAWIKQRSRWVKGYAQTGLVMLRAPLRTGSAMGWRPYLSALGVVAGLPIVLFTQIVSWALLDLYVVLRVSGSDVSGLERLFPEPLLSLGMLTLLFGNFTLLVAHVAEMHREGRYNLVLSAMTIPFYWFLASIAAWKAMGQLVFRPHFWEKTVHGVSGQAGEVMPERPPHAGNGSQTASAVQPRAAEEREPVPATLAAGTGVPAASRPLSGPAST